MGIGGLLNTLIGSLVLSFLAHAQIHKHPSPTCPSHVPPFNYASSFMEDSTCPAAVSNLESIPVEDEYIVRFLEYRPIPDIKRDLEAALGPEGEGGLGWSWVERHNPAMLFPSDFAVIRTSPRAPSDARPSLATADSILFKLRAAASPLKTLVRGVHAQRMVQRKLAFFRPHTVEGQGEGDGVTVSKGGPGRFQTRPTLGLGLNTKLGLEDDPLHPSLGEPLRQEGQGPDRNLLGEKEKPKGVVGLLNAQELWARGITGQGIRVGIFDTGFSATHGHFAKAVKERTNWTHEPTLDDRLGHGSFVAGVVASSSDECPGFAPDVELFEFRVFTNDQVSFTSWFLDAFNYAIYTKMDIVNLSIGGPDFKDEPFVDKVHEVTASGIAMISAIGNDGPLYGTLNNPADMLDVLGVGGIDNNGQMASFSSRGLTLWEQPYGQGRVKPDVVAYGVGVLGSRIEDGCRSLSGTSVAAPVVAGAAALVASVLPKERRHLLNPASIKQVMVEGANRLPIPNIHEQGMGCIDPVKSAALLAVYEPRASLVPDSLDLASCPYMWPYCTQPLFAGRAPLIFNATILNGMGVVGYVVDGPFFEPDTVGNGAPGAKHLDVRFEHSPVLHPWSGWLAVYIRIKPSGAKFDGIASGTISFTVRSPPGRPKGGGPGTGTAEGGVSVVRVPLRVWVNPVVERGRRVLWDMYHNAKYPSAFVPKDSFEARSDSLDWHGDHPHTNFRELFEYLVHRKSWAVDLMYGPATCFDASEYGAFLVVDPEEEWMPEELDKLSQDVRGPSKLGLVVLGDWHNWDHAQSLRFYDDNTRSWWTPVTGGANVPAVNELLGKFGLELSEHVVAGTAELCPADQAQGISHKVALSAASTIRKAPAGAFLFKGNVEVKKTPPNTPGPSTPNFSKDLAVAAYVPGVDGSGGRVAVFGDSDCIDSDSTIDRCLDLVAEMIEAALSGQDKLLTSLAAGRQPLAQEYVEEPASVPQRFPERPFDAHSHVLRDRRLYGGPRCTLASPKHPAWTKPGPLLPPGHRLNLSWALERLRTGAAELTSVKESPFQVPALTAPLPQYSGEVQGRPSNALTAIDQFQAGQATSYSKLVFGLLGLVAIVTIATCSTRRGGGGGGGKLPGSVEGGPGRLGRLLNHAEGALGLSRWRGERSLAVANGSGTARARGLTVTSSQ